MLDLGPSPKLMPESVYADVHDMYPAGAVPATITSDGREAHFSALSDLCAQVIMQCRTVSGSRSNNLWTVGPHSIDSIMAGMGNPADQALIAGLSVGELLSTSNEFLRISQVLVIASPHKSSLSSRQSSVDYSHHTYSGNAPFQQLHHAGVSSNYSPNPPQFFDDKDSGFSPSSMASLTTSTATSITPGVAEQLDFPTILTLYTCYTHLLRIYRILLTRIHVAILSETMPWSSLDNIVPGIYPEGGARAQQRPDLQVKLFMQVCRDLLTQMEKSVTLSTKFYHGGAEPELLQALVETLVEAEASEDAARTVSPKTLVDEIMRTIDGSLGV